MAIGLGRPTLFSDTWEGESISHFVLILAKLICKFGIFIFPAGALAGKARSKVFFEMNRTETDQMLSLYSLLLFFFFPNVVQHLSILRRTKSISLM